MQQLRSRAIELCPVVLPYKGRQVYMQEIDAANPVLPDELADYLPVVEHILAMTPVRSGIVYMTVDEKVVTAGNSQRRSGPHVDGCFNGRYWGHGQGGWNHFCNFLPVERMSVIVAASVAGCKVWEGDFVGEPTNDGDLSHLVLPEGKLVAANTAVWLSPDCVHESLPFEQDTERSFLRLAMPVGSYPH